MIHFTQTQYWTSALSSHAAILVRWADITTLFGRPHMGTPADDATLISALMAAGAPGWVQTAATWLDDEGWGFIGPQG